MIVKYNSGKHEAINLNPVVVKNGAGGFYLSNKMESKFNVGDKFNKNDIIAINDTSLVITSMVLNSTSVHFVKWRVYLPSVHSKIVNW